MAGLIVVFSGRDHGGSETVSPLAHTRATIETTPRPALHNVTVRAEADESSRGDATPSTSRRPAEGRVIRLAGETIETRDTELSRRIRSGAAFELQTRQKTSIRDGVPFIVQFDNPVQPEWKTAISDAGGILRGYLPDHAFIVDMPPEHVDRLAHVPHVQWIGEYLPRYKVRPSLAELAAVSDAGDEITVEIRTFDPEKVTEVAQLLTELGASVTAISASWRRGKIRASVNPPLVGEIARLGDVEWLEEFVSVVPFSDIAVGDAWLNVTNVWTAHGLTGSNQVIGQCDSGLDIGNTVGIHPDFAGRIRSAYALGRPGDWSDPYGHGTHIAGCILGDGTQSSGQFRAPAYRAELVMQSVLGPDLVSYTGIPSDLNVLFGQAYGDDARVHCNAWGQYGQDGVYSALSEDVDEFMWNNDDMLIVLACGNFGIDNDADGMVDLDAIAPPATAKNCLTVGATESLRWTGGYAAQRWNETFGDYPAEPIELDYISWPDNETYQGMAALSSRGPTDDNRVKPEIVAPGTDIVAAWSQEPGAWVRWAAHSNPYYAYAGGTSMSCGLMAGLAALTREYFIARAGITNPSAALIKAMLLNGALSLTPGQYNMTTPSLYEVPEGPRPNVVEGWGMANLGESLYPSGNRRVVVFDRDELAAAGNENEYWMYVASTEELRVTLVWSDYPSSPAAGGWLVNDIDLILSNSVGQYWYGNNGDGPQTFDGFNTVEGCDRSTPPVGVWRIAVNAYQVNASPQPYALVISGDIELAPDIVHTPLTNEPAPHVVDADITCQTPINTNALAVFYNTTGSTSVFTRAAMSRVSGDTCRATIPLQGGGATIYYYISAATNGLPATHPADAPGTLHSFQETVPCYLTVVGSPGDIGTVAPAYGVSAHNSGTMIDASAPNYIAGGVEYAVTGWVGSGNAPAYGDSNSFSFVISDASSIDWKWSVLQARLTETTPTGTTTSWYPGGTAASTAVAEATVFIPNISFISFHDVTTNEGSGTTISFTHDAGSGDNRMLIVGAGWEDDGDDISVSSLTYDGVGLSFIRRETALEGNGWLASAELWYMTNPPTGPSTIEIVLSQAPSRNPLAAALTLTGVAQQGPEATGGSGEPAGADDISTVVTTVTDGAWIIDVAMCGNNAEYTPTSGQTERWDFADTGALTSRQAGGTKLIPVAGVVTSSWTSANANRQVLVSAAFAPAPSGVGTNFHFAEWWLDGARYPDDTNTTVHQISGISMSTSHAAEAIYIPEDRDDDTDTMPDWWEHFHFGSTNPAAADDEDSDPASNIHEYIADTDPRDALSYLRVTAMTNWTDSLIYFPSSTNRTYSLEYCDDLNIGAWNRVPGQTNLPGTGGVFIMSDSNAPASGRFYRIRVYGP